MDRRSERRGYHLVSVTEEGARMVMPRDRLDTKCYMPLDLKELRVTTRKPNSAASHAGSMGSRRGGMVQDIHYAMNLKD